MLEMVFLLGLGVCEVSELLRVQCSFLNSIASPLEKQDYVIARASGLCRGMFAPLARCCQMTFLKSFKCLKWDKMAVKAFTRLTMQWI